MKMEAVSSFTTPLISKPTRHHIYEDCSIQYDEDATYRTKKGFKFNSWRRKKIYPYFTAFSLALVPTEPSRQ